MEPAINTLINNTEHEVHNAYAKISALECHHLITWESERAMVGEVTSFAVWVKEFRAGILIWSGVGIKKG